MDIVERSRETCRVVKILESFVVDESNGEELFLIYDNFYSTKYWVKYRFQTKNFFTLFFAHRYYVKLRKKYIEGGE